MVVVFAITDWPNKALQPTVLSPLRYDKTAAELGRSVARSATERGELSCCPSALRAAEQSLKLTPLQRLRPFHSFPNFVGTGAEKGAA